VLHIKEAMRAAEKISTADFKVKVSLVASPLYVITTQTLDKDVGEAHFAPPVKPTDS
jgi:translation initiation factor 2 subunit 1